MIMGSSQHFIGDNRPARVHITFDVETGKAIQKEELPMVVGVMGDFSGASPNAKPALNSEDRRFIDVTAETIDDVMRSLRPGIRISVPDRLSDDPDAKVQRQIVFQRMQDFTPLGVALAMDDTRAMLAERQELQDLLSDMSTDEGGIRTTLDDILHRMQGES
jgi:type VI secretion system protein ImpB